MVLGPEDTVRAYLEVAERQWSNRCFLMAHQRREETISNAAQNTLWYGQLQSGRIDRLTDLHTIEPIGKEELRHFMLFASRRPAGEVHYRETSGTTGEPLRVLFDQREEALGLVEVLRHYRHLGISPQTLETRPWLVAQLQPFEAKFPINPIPLPPKPVHRRFAFPLGETDWRERLDQLRRCTPTVVVGLPNFLETFCQRIRAEDAPRPQLVMTAGERLRPDQRRLLESTFGCPAYSRYATTELGIVAAECPRQDGLHINVEHAEVEVLDENLQPAPEGEPGELVVTPLTNQAMPLLRYRTGDLGAISRKPCPCGIKYPRIQGLLGRKIEFFINKHGSRYDPWPISQALSEAGYRRFRVEQREMGAIEVLFESGIDDDSSRGRVKKTLAEVSGDSGISFRRAAKVQRGPKATIFHSFL